MIRTEQIRTKKYKALSNQCHLAKNLYNEANYIVRQVFIQTTKLKEEGKIEKAEWVRYNELDRILQSSDNYKSLPAQSAQQTLRLLDKNWKSFFQAIKQYTKTPDKFTGKPSLPKYKDKDGESILIFTKQNCKIKNGYIKFPKKSELKSIKTRLQSFREIRIIPNRPDYTVEIVYEKPGTVKQELPLNRMQAIDLGATNIITIVNNLSVSPIVVKDNGKGIKSINQFYNKEKARLQSIYDLQGIKEGKQMQRLNGKHSRKIKDTTHKLSRFIIDSCVSNNIGKLIIGYNQAWKQGANLGRRTNQTFTQIPYLTIMNQMNYKSKEIGIEIVEQEESYTSKCSFLDNEPIKHHGAYMGKRVSRGMFVSSKGVYINADVNAGYNIMRKSEPKAFANGVGGCRLHPISVSDTNKRNLLKMIDNV